MTTEGTSTSTTPTMTRFRGDLWHADTDTVRLACEGIMRGRGFTPVRVHPRTTGLYATVELTNGHHVTIGYDVIRDYVWKVA